MEADRAEQDALTGRLQTQQQELQRTNMDLQMHKQKLEQDQVSLDEFKAAVDAKDVDMNSLLEAQRSEFAMKT